MNGSDSIHSSGGRETDDAPAEDLEEGEVESETEDQLPASHVSISSLHMDQLLSSSNNNLARPIQIMPLAQPSHENRSDEQDLAEQPNALSNMPQMSIPDGQASTQCSCRWLWWLC